MTGVQTCALPILCAAFNTVLETAQKYKVDMRAAAYVVAINRVATVTKLRGMYA